MMFRKKRILLAEDETRLRNGLEFILASAGYNVVAVEDGEKAYNFLKDIKENKKIDILVTDMMMPKVNGLELLQKLNTENLLPPVVLGISAYADEATVSEMKNAGCNELIDKPFQVTELLAMIAESSPERSLLKYPWGRKSSSLT
jgi:two-component system alkaline phosphatase synthesis response regulator PhoP